MHESQFSENHHFKVPRGAYLFTVLVIGSLLSIISEKLTLGPSWIIITVVVILLVPMVIPITCFAL